MSHSLLPHKLLRRLTAILLPDSGFAEGTAFWLPAASITHQPSHHLRKDAEAGWSLLLSSFTTGASFDLSVSLADVCQSCQTKL